MVTRRSHESLGTIVTISIYGRADNELFEKSFKIADKIHDLMSLEVADSDLSRINGSAGVSAVDIDPMTREVLEEALHLAVISNSAFTPLIQPLVSLWDIGGDNPRIPSPEELEKAVGNISLDDLRIIPAAESSSGNNQVYLAKKGMGVDLGGIAKGFAADEVKEFLVNSGVERAILDFGGNIVTIGSKRAEQSWTIGVQRPDQDRGEYLGTLPSVDNSIVTSGVYERYFQKGGYHYHHLLNSKTGYPENNGLEGVVIVAENSMLADGYSTAVFILGKEAGMRLVESTEEIEAVFIDRDKSLSISSGLQNDFVLRNREYQLAPAE